MSFIRNWLNRRTLKNHALDPQHWNALCTRLPLLCGLSDEQRQRLGEQVVLFLQHKRISPLQGLELSEDDRLHLAAQACLPLLALPDHDWYRGFREILLYPAEFLSPQHWIDEDGIEHFGEEVRSGEAWQQGPVILAWPGVQEAGGLDGDNLVIHELAHKLDMLGGDANGQPPLHADMHPTEWAQQMQAAYDWLCNEIDNHPQREPPIDSYAAESPAEFFAVCSEYFFSAPDLLQRAFPQVYGQLRLFYRQDPLLRLRPWLPAPEA